MAAKLPARRSPPVAVNIRRLRAAACQGGACAARQFSGYAEVVRVCRGRGEAAPVVVAGQWFKYPSEGLPRNADGSLNRNAPTPRLPEGRPDLSGLWHAADPNRCKGRGGQFAQCGNEIGGSPLGGNLGRNLPGGSLPYRPEAATCATPTTAATIRTSVPADNRRGRDAAAQAIRAEAAAPTDQRDVL
jgi:hypothetical protein